MSQTLEVPGLSRLNIEQKLYDFVLQCPRGAGSEKKGLDVWGMVESGEISNMTGFDLKLPEENELSPNIKGQTDFSDRVMVLSSSTYEGVKDDKGHDRFTVMHEVTHCLLHDKHITSVHLELKNPVVVLNRGSIPAYRDAEWQANNGSACFLLPLAEMVDVAKHPQYIPGDPEILHWLSDAYAVSLSTAFYRMKHIDFLLYKHEKEVMQLIYA